MPRLLFVEDSATIASMVAKRIREKLHYDVKWTRTLKDTIIELEGGGNDFFAALLDLNLPDAPRGEVIDYVLSMGIPSIVFTGEINEDFRERFWAKKVVDYVYKEGSHNIDYVVSLLRRIYLNQNIKVLVVDDSKTARKYISGLLKVHNYQVVEAKDGIDALKVMRKNDDICMVITDYYMPKLDGFDLTMKIRGKFNKENLAIIGISAEGDKSLSARFIKNGANDFITKPFNNEEFYCRITQNIEMIEHIRTIENFANTDFLTGLYNRKYFFESAPTVLANAIRSITPAAVAMIDVDHFKKINDTYGHNAGDIVLKKLSSILKERFRKSDMLARIGGEEFCVLVTGIEQSHLQDFFDALRKFIKQATIDIGEREVSITVSIGVCMKALDSLNDMINSADERLYDAKNSGRNKVVVSL